VVFDTIDTKNFDQVVPDPALKFSYNLDDF